MTRAAYFLSKEAEEALVDPLLKLLNEHHFVKPNSIQKVYISSPLEAIPWDILVVHQGGQLFVDIKLAPLAPRWGRIADKTFSDIKKTLQAGVLVLLFVPPRIYLLSPDLLPFLPEELTLGFLEASTPSTSVDPEVSEQVWQVYERMVLS